MSLQAIEKQRTILRQGGRIVAGHGFHQDYVLNGRFDGGIGRG
jgi:hypothetical protein